MDYKLSVENETCPVTVEKTGDTSFTAVIKDSTHEVEITRLTAHSLLLTVNGRQVRAGIVKTAEGKQIVLHGQQYNVVDEDLLEQAGPARRSRKKALTEVTAPMPAEVISIAVEPGETVTEGQPVAVVSAMKMETTLYAPFDGVVTGVNVSPGEKVMPGVILVDIEKNDDSG
ncbi:MAG: biotin/lipoyl-containing protein [Desulfosudaceae bacterium]